MSVSKKEKTMIHGDKTLASSFLFRKKKTYNILIFLLLLFPKEEEV